MSHKKREPSSKAVAALICTSERDSILKGFDSVEAAAQKIGPDGCGEPHCARTHQLLFKQDGLIRVVGLNPQRPTVRAAALTAAGYIRYAGAIHGDL